MIKQLNPQQLAAVHLGAKNALVIAGAGCGKTATIIERVSFLLEQNIDPQRMLVLTFSRRAAQELINRLQIRYPQQASLVMAGTFHRFCVWALRKYNSFFLASGPMVIIDREDQVTLLQAARQEFLEQFSTNSQTTDFYKQNLPKATQLVSLFSYIRSTNMEIAAYLQTYSELKDSEDKAQTISAVETIFGSYEQKKQQRNFLDFDDLLIKVVLSLEQDERLRAIFKDLFSYILVDEFQDTNILQWRILQALVDPAKIFCVGDDAQSIYAFRGASVENFHRFLDTVPTAIKLPLTINYRSTQRILDLANYVLTKSTIDYDKHLQSVRGAGNIPLLKEFNNNFEEANWIIADFQQKIAAGYCAADDILIMVRAAWHAKTLEAMLVDKKIKYRFIGGIGLFNASHTKDLLAICRASFNFKDDIAWLRWLQKFAGIGAKKAERISLQISKFETPAELFEFIKLKYPQLQEINDAVSICLQNQDDPEKLLRLLIPAVENRVAAKYMDWRKRKNDWWLLADIATKFTSIYAFMETYTIDPLTTSEASLSDNQPAITVITIHSVKGAEAKLCYIIGAQKGSFPSSYAQTAAEIEEERRVFYVALTRAKDQLIITRSVESKNYYLKDVNSIDFVEDLTNKKELIKFQPCPIYRSVRSYVWR